MIKPKHRMTVFFGLLLIEVTGFGVRANTINLGAFQITDTTVAGGYTWTAPVTGNTNFVPSTDTLVATIPLTIVPNLLEQALINTAAPLAGGTGWIHSQTLRLDADRSVSDLGIAATNAVFTFTPRTGPYPATLVYAPPKFSTTQAGGLGTFDTRADFEIEVGRPLLESNPESSEIQLTAGGPPPTSGAAGGARTGTAGITYLDPPAETVTTMQAPSPGGAVRIYTFDSTDGTTMQINGFDSSGFSLDLASSNLLTFLDFAPSGDHEAVFDSSVLFALQYLQGATTVGHLNQSGSVWAALGPPGTQPLYFTGFSYTGTPPVLPGNGATMFDPVSSLGSGSTALWLDFETSFKTGQNTSVGFLIVGETDAVPDPPTWLLFGTGVLGLLWLARKGERRRPTEL